MKLIRIKTLADINKGDTLSIKGNHAEGEPLQVLTLIQVKVTEKNGTEIILRKKGNVYVNWGMYLDGKSWVKEVQKVDDTPELVGMRVNFDGFRRV
jgi:hypothetical protein